MLFHTKCLLCFAILLILSACSNGQSPFKAKYTSPDEVVVTYQGKNYTLNRFQKNDGLPFQYSFENDGDLDLMVAGKEYEIDSPYDRDKKKTTKKTSLKKKKNQKTTKK